MASYRAWADFYSQVEIAVKWIVPNVSTAVCASLILGRTERVGFPERALCLTPFRAFRVQQLRAYSGIGGTG